MGRDIPMIRYDFAFYTCLKMVIISCDSMLFTAVKWFNCVAVKLRNRVSEREFKLGEWFIGKKIKIIMEWNRIRWDRKTH